MSKETNCPMENWPVEGFPILSSLAYLLATATEMEPRQIAEFLHDFAHTFDDLKASEPNLSAMERIRSGQSTVLDEMGRMIVCASLADTMYNAIFNREETLTDGE